MLRVALGTKLAGEDVANDVQKVENRGLPANITTATTTTIKTGPGHINEIRIAGGVLGAVTIYDNTAGSGSVIVPTVTPLQGQLLISNVEFSVGLTIVTTAATIVTVSYR